MWQIQQTGLLMAVAFLFERGDADLREIVRRHFRAQPLRDQRHVLVAGDIDQPLAILTWFEFGVHRGRGQLLVRAGENGPRVPDVIQNRFGRRRGRTG